MKGLCGLLALLVPLAWQALLAVVDAARSPRGRLPLSVVMTLVLLSFGKNLEIEAYSWAPTRPRWRPMRAPGPATARTG